MLLDDLLLMVALDCNIACTMCYQKSDRNRFAPVPERRLSADMLWQQVPFHRIKRLIIQGGEPTIIPEALELLQRLNRMPPGAPVVNLVTNGLSLPPAVLQCVRNRSEFIYISINGATRESHSRVNRGSTWQKVVENIDVLRAMRATSQARFTIVGGYTIVPSNIREVPQFIATHPSLGFDSISFNYDISACMLLAHDAQLKITLQSQIKEAIGENPSRLGHLAKLAELGLIT
jgi:MoaA/NifB/PqqE/SkfB family radical SAM enzyme